MRGFVMLFCLVTSIGQAQTVVDGSGTDIEAERLKSLIEFVAHDFIDPHSTQLRELKVGPQKNNTEIIYCGEINGKNRYGAYVGYEKFMVALKIETGTYSLLTSSIIRSKVGEAADAMFREIWEGRCK